jgi:predicted anti-sigma-YlaC factor YlaD
VDCREIQIRLAGGEALDAAQRRHLQGCPDCRDLAAVLQDAERLLAEPATTPAPLRADTLARCREELTAPAPAARRRGPRLSPRAVMAAALLGTAVLVGVTVAVSAGEASLRFAAQAVFTQFALQNVMAALLAPALWPMLRRLVAGQALSRSVTGE